MTASVGVIAIVPWPSSGNRSSACAASAWRTCGGTELHMQAAQLRVRASSVPNEFVHTLSAH
eukprot:15438715-Alexandrium_andersonii.AAC.1